MFPCLRTGPRACRRSAGRTFARVSPARLAIFATVACSNPSRDRAPVPPARAERRDLAPLWVAACIYMISGLMGASPRPTR